MWEYTYSDELYHHGVKGMKWGVRRYQNKDGTLTAAGKKRYLEKSDGLYSKFKAPKTAMDGDGLSTKAKRFDKNNVIKDGEAFIVALLAGSVAKIGAETLTGNKLVGWGAYFVGANLGMNYVYNRK